jgi:hypothetical protein
MNYPFDINILIKKEIIKINKKNFQEFKKYCATNDFLFSDIFKKFNV